VRVKCLPPEGLPEPRVLWTTVDDKILSDIGSMR